MSLRGGNSGYVREEYRNGTIKHAAQAGIGDSTTTMDSYRNTDLEQNWFWQCHGLTPGSS